MKYVNIVGLAILSIYISFVWYMISKLYWSEGALQSRWNEIKVAGVKNESHQKIVEIWSKAAIGNFLWEHVFNAHLEDQIEGIWSYGEMSVNQLIFRFRTGPSVIPSKLPENSKNAILILDGKQKKNIEYSQMWLNYIPVMQRLKNVALLILGSEECKNEWLTPYLSAHGGYLKVVFLVYDSIFVDEKMFYQWPLGVAEHFSRPSNHDLKLKASRPFRCNFVGTIYTNSSHEVLLKVITDNNFQKECFVEARYEWLPKETSSKNWAVYTQILLNSDLTLNPVCKNSECSGIYEALSCGSVPVIENMMTPGECGKKNQFDNAPFRLLKEHKAPVIYVTDWKRELPEILAREKRMSLAEIVNRRQAVVKWYIDFKEKMKENFINIITKKFFLDSG